MGLNVLRRNCDLYPKRNKIQAPNPNPLVFEIISIIQVKRHVVVKIKYPNCTNYEGMKVLLYLNCDVDDIKNLSEIDPHFSKSGLSPFARFIPTYDGYFAAVKLANTLNDTHGVVE
jgi:hypothetical protein